MPAISVSAPGKVILCGEHAVVYGTPAIALPVFQVSTKTKILARPSHPIGEVKLVASAIGLDTFLSELPETHPIRLAVTLVLQELGIESLPACEIRISSSIPLGAGLGSSASLSVSLIRALSTFVGHPLVTASVNPIAFELEKVHHGSPSGIDNTVISYQTPVFFQRDVENTPIHVKNAFSLVIADSGIKSSTSDAVAGVNQRWKNDPALYEGYFNEIGRISNQVRKILESGDPLVIGPLLSENHEILKKIGVSSSTLDQMVNTALQAGAIGAKLSGGGIGGNIIALAEPGSIQKIEESLSMNGAIRTICTTIPAWKGSLQ